MAVVRDRQVSSQFTSLHIPNTNLFSFLTTNLHEKSTDRKVVVCNIAYNCTLLVSDLSFRRSEPDAMAMKRWYDAIIKKRIAS